MMEDRLTAKCPRCGEGELRAWDELTDEERVVARGMPEAVDYSPGERQAMHRWCSNCSYEETESRPCDA